MLVLDTDHFSEWERGSTAGRRLRARLQSSTVDFGTTVVTVEEQMRGWLGEIRRNHDPHRQITPYGKLQRQVEAFAEWLILPWEADAAHRFIIFRRQGVRIGSLDLKIASITFAHDAVLLTRNIRDFSQVPGLRVENWVD